MLAGIVDAAEDCEKEKPATCWMHITCLPELKDAKQCSCLAGRLGKLLKDLSAQEQGYKNKQKRTLEKLIARAGTSLTGATTNI